MTNTKPLPPVPKVLFELSLLVMSSSNSDVGDRRAEAKRINEATDAVNLNKRALKQRSPRQRNGVVTPRNWNTIRFVW